MKSRRGIGLCYRCRVLLFCSSTFFLLGVVLVILGVHQAELARDLRLDLAQSGFLGAALALGLGIGVVLSGPLVDRASRRALLVASSLLSALALLCVEREVGYARMVVQVAVLGIGCGFYETVINAIVVERWSARATGALALVHAAATAGAGAGPMLVHALSADGHWPRSFRVLGALHVLLAAVALFAPLPVPAAAPALATRAEPKRAHAAPLSLWALCAVGFAYVGVESGLTLFAVPWAAARGEVVAMGQRSISALWVGLLLGRLTLAALPRLRGAPLLAANGLAGAGIVLASNQLAIGPLPFVTGLAGIALGPVYPAMMALAAERFPQRVGRVFGLVAGAGAAGGFVLPWVFGVVGDAFGMRIALAVLGVTALLIAAGAGALARRPVA